MYNLQIIENRIMAIAKEKGLSKNKLLINAHLGKSFFDNMKKGQVPSVEKMHIMADYLKVSIDYLVGRTDEPTTSHHTNNVSSSFVQSDNSVNLGSVSVASAFNNSSNDISSSKEEKEILNIYRSLSARDRTKFMNFVFDMEDNIKKA